MCSTALPLFHKIFSIYPLTTLNDIFCSLSKAMLSRKLQFCHCSTRFKIMVLFHLSCNHWPRCARAINFAFYKCCFCIISVQFCSFCFWVSLKRATKLSVTSFIQAIIFNSWMSSVVRYWSAACVNRIMQWASACLIAVWPNNDWQLTHIVVNKRVSALSTGTPSRLIALFRRNMSLKM